MGLFHPFLDDKGVRIVGVEAAGHGIETGQHAASLTGGRPGVLHGNRTYLLQDKEGQIIEAHSISAGLDYPGIGPEHSWLKEQGRVEYVSATDDEALDAFQLLCKLEGIIPALESSHALAHVTKLAPTLPKDNLLVDESLRSRRQGRAAGRRAHGDQALMGRITKRFAELKADKRAGLVAYISAGDPDAATGYEILKGLPAAGADLIELGMPFTDPMADGPSVQARRPARAQGRHHRRRDLRHGAPLPPGGRQRHADPADGLLQSRLSARPRDSSARKLRRRASTASSWSTCRRKKPMS